MTIEEIARKLFIHLDDCDTADDIAKADDALFRYLVRHAQKQRFEYASTDGILVTFNNQPN